MSNSSTPVLERTQLDGSATHGASAAKIPLTRDQLISLIVASLEKLPKVCFDSLYRIEFGEESDVRKMSTTGTALEPVVAVMNQAGVPTSSTVGDVMEGLDITKEQVHDLVCYCLGEEITGAQLAQRFRYLY